jgi:hypothetical protein
MLFYSAYTASTAENELQQSCNNIFLPFRHLFYSCFLTLTPSLPLQVGEGRKGCLPDGKAGGKRNDPLFIPNSTISQTTSFTKYLPCSIPVNAWSVCQLENIQTLKYFYKTYTNNQEILK